ncbi:MAG: ABC transporter substrate-binding protein [bacterium]|nr:ABC transporter substrate-binding protein [Acidimicrobiia bacterium]MCY4649331.1 ABC transporter substrate-binding protein [bacterium]
MRLRRLLSLLAVLALVAAACGDDEEAPETTSAPAPETTAAPAPETTAAPDAMEDEEEEPAMEEEEPAMEEEEEEPAMEEEEPAMEEEEMPMGATYRLGIFSAPTTDNPWAALDTEAEIWNTYVIPGQISLYTYQGPTYTVVPALASDPSPPQVEADGDGYSVTVNLLSDVTWSDGSPITAHDAAFTFNTIKKYDGLGGNFTSIWPLARDDDPATEDDESSQGVSSVEALDDHTVKITFNFEPGLAIWPLSVGLASIFQEAFWGPIVDESDDFETLYAASGLGAPNASAFDSAEWEPGAFWRNVAIDSYWDSGSQYTVYSSGAVEYTRDGATETWGGDPGGDVLTDYTEGPFVGESLYSIYTDQNAAVLALTEGEVDFLLNPLGLQSGLRNEILAAPNLEVAVNDQNGMRYLAYNTRKFPMNDASFRRALACMIDKDFVANTVLGGTAYSINSLVPPGNAYWYNPDITAPCGGQSSQERVASAVQILKDGGWTWDVEPVWDEGNRDVIPKGEGLRGPGGETIDPLTLLAPGPGYDPMRATYSLFIEEWASDLGIPLEAEPTGFSVIVDKVFVGDPLLWDIYILGWGLTPFPDHVFDFFRSSRDSALGGFNTPGYSNPAFDELADQFDRAKTLAEARDLIHQADAIIAEDLPYVTLFNTPLIEAYSNQITFPYTTILDGLQAVGALTGVVTIG